MTPAVLIATTAAGLAAALVVPSLPRLLRRAEPARPPRPERDWLRRWRPLWAGLAAVAAGVFLGGPAAWVGAPAAAAGTWWVIERSEPPTVRRDRELARRDLPHLVGLLADALRAGQSPAEATGVVVAALPGPAADRLGEVVPRLRLGLDPLSVWAEVAADPGLGPLGRAMSRAHRTGAPVVTAVERLAGELARSARADVEDRARAVGVKAALPLGLCLLPAFVLIGIVPVVGGLLSGLGI